MYRWIIYISELGARYNISLFFLNHRCLIIDWERQSHDTVWQVIKKSLYLIGSDRKQRPQARRAFCHRLRAAIALLNVTGIGLSPRWNLQNGTRPACVQKRTSRIKYIQNIIKHKNKIIIYFCSFVVHLLPLWRPLWTLLQEPCPVALWCEPKLWAGESASGRTLGHSAQRRG